MSELERLWWVETRLDLQGVMWASDIACAKLMGVASDAMVTPEFEQAVRVEGAVWVAWWRAEHDRA